MAVLGLGLVMLATAPFSVWPGGAVEVFSDLYVKVIIIFALMVNTLTTQARLRAFINVVVLGTSYIGVRAVVDYARGVNLVEDGRVTGAVGGLFGNPNDMALNMVAFLPLGIVIGLGRGRPALRLLALIGVPAITGAIIFSKSRGGTVGLLAMMLVLLYQMRRLRPGVAVLVVAASLATLPLLPSSFTSRMSSIFNAEEDPTGSREARKQLLREGYQAFLDHPVFGLGAGQFQNYQPENREEAWRETHNAVLQVAAELGIVGLIVFMLLVGYGFAAVFRTGSTLRRIRRARRAREPDPVFGRREPLELYASAMMASLTGWFVAALFASVAYYWTFYIVLGLAVALRDVTMRDLESSPVSSPDQLRAKAA
jgi:O-antigen ligase